MFFADERCVALDHADSNYKLCKDLLFSKVSIPSENIFPIDSSLRASPEQACGTLCISSFNNLSHAQAAAAYETKLKSVLSDAKSDSKSTEIPKFDLLLLGMGPDGHCCSLFPEHALLKVQNFLVYSLHVHVAAAQQRSSLLVDMHWVSIINLLADIALANSDAKKESLRKVLESPKWCDFHVTSLD